MMAEVVQSIDICIIEIVEHVIVFREVKLGVAFI